MKSSLSSPSCFWSWCLIIAETLTRASGVKYRREKTHFHQTFFTDVQTDPPKKLLTVISSLYMLIVPRHKMNVEKMFHKAKAEFLCMLSLYSRKTCNVHINFKTLATLHFEMR